MYNGKKVIIVLPAFNASKTLAKTVREIPANIADEIVLVDDRSTDNTLEVAKDLDLKNIISHQKNLGYGGNQKTCYKKALELNGDIIVMLHPDYQYTPYLIIPMVSLIASGLYHVVLGSRILGKGALKGGMPIYKYFFNRFLTFIQNTLMNQKLSEYHTGYRAFSKEVLLEIDLDRSSNGYIFDNEMIALIFSRGYEIAEITCPTKYDSEASSINFKNSFIYGLGVLRISFRYFFHRIGLLKWRFIEKPLSRGSR